MFVDTLHTRTDPLDRVQEHIDIPDIREIFYCNGLICHNRSCKNRKRSIFCSTDLYFSN